jgi:hypothetical protein
MPCVIFTVQKEMRSADFFVDQSRRFPSLCLKIGSSDLVIEAQNHHNSFLVYDLKTKQTSVYRLQYKTDRREVGTGHASRSIGLLHVEAYRASVFQSGLKTAGGAMTGGARDIITMVASSES